MNSELTVLTPPTVRRPPKPWLTRKEASYYLEQLGCPTSKEMLSYYAQKNNERKGPPFTRSGWKTIRYQPSDLEAWARSRMVRVE